MAKTVLSAKERNLILKVIRDISQGKLNFATSSSSEIDFNTQPNQSIISYATQNINYWRQYSHDEMNILQAIYNAISFSRDNNTPVNNDLHQDIRDLGIGLDNNWTIIGVEPSVLLDVLFQGLDVFK